MRVTKKTILAATLFLCAGLFFVSSPPPLRAAGGASDLVGPLNSGTTASPVSNPSDFGTILEKVVTWTYETFFIIAVLFFLLAAYNFMLGGSDEKKIATAKNQLTYGVIAIVVALISTGVSAIVYNIFHSS